MIPTLGEAALGRVLDAFGSQDAAPGSFELIVVVDRVARSPDAVEALLADRPYPVRCLTGAIPGASSNRNTGWRAAAAPIVLFTDDDTIPVPRLVSEHLDSHARHREPEAAVVGHVRWAPELKVTPFMRWLDHGVQFTFVSIEGERATWGHLVTANCSIKRPFLERVGGFDEERLPYLYEDLDWAYRAEDHGLVVYYAREAVADHLRHDATLDWWKRKMKRLAEAEHQFSALHPDVAPWFHTLFTEAREFTPVRGRGARLARFVPEWVPWLGPRLWWAADMYWKQQLAPYFLEAWDEAEA